jgi:hypothetical protein
MGGSRFRQGSGRAGQIMIHPATRALTLMMAPAIDAAK